MRHLWVTCVKISIRRPGSEYAPSLRESATYALPIFTVFAMNGTARFDCTRRHFTDLRLYAPAAMRYPLVPGSRQGRKRAAAIALRQNSEGQPAIKCNENAHADHDVGGGE